MAPSVWYAESDGQVYLVRGDDGRWTFPDAKQELPFAAERTLVTQIGATEVRSVRPHLENHPEHWIHKDEVPHMPHVDPLVRQAINASLPRCVAGVVVRNSDGEVLMVKAARGFSQGVWNLPGGFIEYGEHPEAGAVREVREEVGLEVRLDRLLGVFMRRFGSPYFIYAFMYEAKADGRLRPASNEIADARWMTTDAAKAATKSPFALDALAASGGD